MDYPTSPIIFGLLIIAIFTYILSGPSAPSSVPRNLPWVGRDSSRFFSKRRAPIENLANTPIFPGISGPPEIIIPNKSIPWFLEQPDSVLSVSEWHREVLMGEYNFTHNHILKDPYHEHVIHRSLNRNLQPVVMDIWDELGRAFDGTWGMESTTWEGIPLMENLMFIDSRVSKRMFVGTPLCRNNNYLVNMRKFSMDIVVNTYVLEWLPKFSWPVIAPIICARNWWHYSQTAKYTIPFIKERLGHIQRKRNNPSYDWKEPNDYVSWRINLAMAVDKKVEIDPVMISQRLMPLNFAAIHTATISVSNTFLDVLSTDGSKGIVDGLKEEVERDSLAKLIRADSAIRESMRLNNFMAMGALRRVMPADGIFNNEKQWPAPPGAYIGLDIYSIHHDPEVYPCPNDYDAFQPSSANERGATLSKLNNAEMLSTTSATFLSFSHGRHACPGRFFVSYHLKMPIAYMLLNYEVEPLPQRPLNQSFGQASLPPPNLRIRVKRKPIDM
ncbi:cytochrome P450 [Aspergillus alliaceus]|uniref:cytochrome P450 n=1 Tax=Petromyces alliaceus TaxID=209559 RepID=UPI0012A3B26F|nr:putative P450 monooxygenase [Aspergillus alliaceus]KAB8228447.1 putative P450 monooxygenase [Aspergillus alliaceus]